MVSIPEIQFGIERFHDHVHDHGGLGERKDVKLDVLMMSSRKEKFQGFGTVSDASKELPVQRVYICNICLSNKIGVQEVLICSRVHQGQQWSWWKTIILAANCKGVGCQWGHEAKK